MAGSGTAEAGEEKMALEAAILRDIVGASQAAGPDWGGLPQTRQKGDLAVGQKRDTKLKGSLAIGKPRLDSKVVIEKSSLFP